MYTRELVQFGDNLSMLLLLPPSEDFSSSYWPLVGTKEPGLTMPLQIFEIGGWRTVAIERDSSPFCYVKNLPGLYPGFDSGWKFFM